MDDKERERLQTKIDKIMPQIQEMDQLLDSYYNAFMEDGEIDDKEIKQLEKVKKKITEIEAKIANLKAKMSNTSDNIPSDTQNEGIVALRNAKIKELEAIKIELEDMLKFFEVS